MGITENLFQALRRLRCTDRARIFWIDAVCINQNDIAKRNQQVPLMKSIFSKARGVVVWLGEEVDTDCHAFDIIRMFEESPTPDETGKSASKGLRYLQSLPLPEEGSRSKWDSLYSILHRQWYNRIWVIQEVVMAREIRIICGEQTCSWAALIGMATAIMQGGFHVWMSGVEMSSLVNMAALRRRMKERGGQPNARDSIVDLIYATRFCGCTNPHDRLYALLGLLSKYEIADVVVDYGTPYLEVYKSLTVNIIQRRGALAHLILSMAGYRTEMLLLKLPTWVLD
jgi:Heterokaryon incompatibility protein (HET)